MYKKNGESVYIHQKYIEHVPLRIEITDYTVTVSAYIFMSTKGGRTPNGKHIFINVIKLMKGKHKYRRN